MRACSSVHFVQSVHVSEVACVCACVGVRTQAHQHTCMHSCSQVLQHYTYQDSLRSLRLHEAEAVERKHSCHLLGSETTIEYTRDELPTSHNLQTISYECCQWGHLHQVKISHVASVRTPGQYHEELNEVDWNRKASCLWLWDCPSFQDSQRDRFAHLVKHSRFPCWRALAKTNRSWRWSYGNWSGASLWEISLKMWKTFSLSKGIVSKSSEKPGTSFGCVPIANMLFSSLFRGCSTAF